MKKIILATLLLSQPLFAGQKLIANADIILQAATSSTEVLRIVPASESYNVDPLRARCVIAHDSAAFDRKILANTSFEIIGAPVLAARKISLQEVTAEIAGDLGATGESLNEIKSVSDLKTLIANLGGNITDEGLANALKDSVFSLSLKLKTGHGTMIDYKCESNMKLDLHALLYTMANPKADDVTHANSSETKIVPFDIFE